MLDWLKQKLPSIDNVPVGNGPPNTEPRLVELCSPNEPTVDFVLIHDLTEDRRIAWTMPGSNSLWPEKLVLNGASGDANARILLYGYNCGKLDELQGFLSEIKLRRHARELLHQIPLCTQNDDNGGRHDRPVIFFAHGYGGLIYEQAIVLSLGMAREVHGSAPRLRRQGAFLFGTPHFDAGLAQWSVLSATHVGLLRGITAQSLNCSSLDGEIRKTSNMQREFRRHYQENPSTLKVASCFATIPNPKDNLFLSSEWAVLPEFRAIAIRNHHFGMTRLEHPKDQAFSDVSTVLSQWIDEYHSRIAPNRIPSREQNHDPIRRLEEIFSKPGSQTQAAKKFYRLSLPTHNAIQGTIQVGSIIRMMPGGGPILVFATPEIISPGYDNTAPIVTQTGHHWFDTPIDDLRLWEQFTRPLARPGPEPRGRGSFSRQNLMSFERMVTEVWEPNDTYLANARKFQLPTWEGVDKQCQDYIITTIKVVKGARIAARDKGPKSHSDITIAGAVLEHLRARSEGILATDPWNHLARPDDMVIAFSVKELPRLEPSYPGAREHSHDVAKDAENLKGALPPAVVQFVDVGSAH